MHCTSRTARCDFHNGRCMHCGFSTTATQPTRDRDAQFAAHMERLQTEAGMRAAIKAMIDAAAIERKAAEKIAALHEAAQTRGRPLLTAISAIHDSRRARPNEWPS